mgnify:FL=1
MSSSGAKRPKPDSDGPLATVAKHTCRSCGWRAGSKTAFSRHVRSKCKYPRSTRRRTGVLPGCKLHRVSEAPVHQQDTASAEQPLLYVDTDDDSQHQEQHQEQQHYQQQQQQHVDQQTSHESGQAGLSGDSPVQPAAAEDISSPVQPADVDLEPAAEVSDDPSADPYQQFADDILAAAAAAGCLLEADRVWEFVEDTRAAAGETHSAKW